MGHYAAEMGADRPRTPAPRKEMTFRQAKMLAAKHYKARYQLGGRVDAYVTRVEVWVVNAILEAANGNS